MLLLEYKINFKEEEQTWNIVNGIRTKETEKLAVIQKVSPLQRATMSIVHMNGSSRQQSQSYPCFRDCLSSSSSIIYLR